MLKLIINPSIKFLDYDWQELDKQVEPRLRQELEKKESGLDWWPLDKGWSPRVKLDISIDLMHFLYF